MLKNKNFIWHTIGTTLNSFLSLFLLVVVTRVNGIELSGKFSFVFTLTLILQYISNYGCRTYQVSDITDEFAFQEYFGSRIKTSIISIMVFVIAMIYYKFNPELIIVASLFMIFRIVETFSDVFYGSFQKNERLDYVGISLTLKSLFSFLIFTIIEYFTHNIVYASIGFVLNSFIVLWFYDIKKVKNFEILKIKYNNIIYKRSKYIFMFGLVVLLILNVSRFIGFYTLNDTDMTYLGILLMIPSVMLLICQFIIQPQITTLAELFKKNKVEEFENILKKCIITLLSLSAFCIILAITLGPTVLKFLYQLDFKEHRFNFVVLILAGTFNGLTSIYSGALNILGNTKIQFRNYVIILIIDLLLTCILSSFYKLTGMCIAMAIALLLQSVMFLYSYKKEKKLNFI